VWGSRLRPHVALVAGPPAHVPPQCFEILSRRCASVKNNLLPEVWSSLVLAAALCGVASR
jgi:hypothetical protein